MINTRTPNTFLKLCDTYICLEISIQFGYFVLGKMEQYNENESKLMQNENFMNEIQIKENKMAKIEKKSKLANKSK